jgi:hypothetical protein
LRYKEKMNMKAFIISSCSLWLIVGQVFSAQIVIETTGTADDAHLIQTALDGLQVGDTLRLNGDFVIKKTIYLPSNFTWILAGSLTLSSDAELNEAGWIAAGIDATRRTGITEKTGGATNIDMSGGTYYGNSANYTKSMRFLNFVSVTNSKFHDMQITEVTDDNFTLGPGCHDNECLNLIGSFAGGNALTDKGDHNRWYDCVAEDCASDGWTPKCRYSEFYRCIARRNEGPGFGMFCRIDGSGNPADLGEAIEGNKFYACKSYDNNAAGFSFNVSNTSGEGGSITNNYIEAECYNNASSGVRFRNKMPNSIVDNNEINLLCYGNRGLTKSGDPSNVAGGLGNDANSSYRVTGITGSMVSYDNTGADVNTDKAFDCSITVYHPLGKKPPAIKKGDDTNNITVVGFNCLDPLDEWCKQAYCSQDVILHSSSDRFQNSNSLMQSYPNPFNVSTNIKYTIPKRSFTSLKVFDPSGRELTTLVNEEKSKGAYEVVFNGRELASGTYYYRIYIEGYTETKKIVRQK